MFKPIKVNAKIERIDKFLVDELKLSRSKITTMISNKNIMINDEIVRKPGVELSAGDIISYNHVDVVVNDSKPFDAPLAVHYEDEDLLVVYKESGILTHPTQFNEQDTLINILLNYANGKFKPFLIHRLDKDTSGLLIFAKNEKTQAKLLKMMEQREIVKKYYAIVNTKMTKNHLLINVPICRANDNRLKMVAGEGKNPKEALTEVFLLKTWDHYSLVDIILHTGRTHQIRVHLKYINNPILNDPLYSFNNSKEPYNQYLMAYNIKFTHPNTKKVIDVKIDYDKEFKSLLERLEVEKNPKT
ncbi:MAG: RluA family pseudouridine synthase [Mycoplasma sp.]